MPDSLSEWAGRVRSGDRRAVARAISAIENGDPAGVKLLKSLFAGASRSQLIGVTGSPGAGKSTLVERLAVEYRRGGKRVGIIAVDPSSPFSGGAILGDRVRMQSLATDDGVYIRSMATRGHLGGLAPAAHDVVTVLEAAGCEVVLVETVGVGQDEVEVARLADATVLLLAPGMGDDIQTFKAGVMEIADIFVINKADHPGAARVEQEVTAMLNITPRPDAWRPPVLKTVATAGEGIGELRHALDQFQAFGERTELKRSRERSKWRARLLGMLRQTLFERAVEERLQQGEIDRYVEDVIGRRRDPHSVVEELVAESMLVGRD
ncbi:MAG TPA: methylmalonyl Co-A mutase-associated GTPase MeaB [Terriglobia bacterium]|nr:methylmalonyl Co-A mutase-associated GTPase MeaB [Terriglobia bacterium]